MGLATVCIIKNKHDEVLFLNRNYKPFGYGLPGGKVEQTDDNIYAACIREIFEETGIVVEKEELTYTGKCGRFKSASGSTIVEVFYCSKIISAEDVILSSEHSDFCFTKEYSVNFNLAGNTLDFIQGSNNITISD